MFNESLMRFLRSGLVLGVGICFSLLSISCLDLEDDLSKNIGVTAEKLKGQWSGGVGFTSSAKIVDFILNLPEKSDDPCSVSIQIGRQYIPGASFEIEGFAHYYQGAFLSEKKGIDLIVLNSLVQKAEDVKKISTIFDMIKVISTMSVSSATEKAQSSEEKKEADTTQTKRKISLESVVTKFIQSAIDQKDRINEICAFLEKAKGKSDAKFFLSIPIRISKLATDTRSGETTQRIDLILQPILFTPLAVDSLGDAAQQRSKTAADLIKQAATASVSYDFWLKKGSNKETFRTQYTGIDSNSKKIEADYPNEHSLWKEMGWFSAIGNDFSEQGNLLSTRYYEGIRTAANFWLYLGIADREKKLMLIQVKKKK